MGVTYPGESEAYRAARDELLQQEIELRRAMEQVAASVRALPPGGVVPEDYAFHGLGPDGTAGPVRLSELFAPGRDSLVIYNYMFPRHPADERPGPTEGPLALLPLIEGPCPSCTAFLDQLDGAAEHFGQRANLVISAKVPLERVLAVAADRGWRHLRLVSSLGTTFPGDYNAEDDHGNQAPMMNVFHRDGDGAIRHHWGSELMFEEADPGQDPRHNGTIEPLWTLFDLTREGRPDDWQEQLRYE